MKKSLLVLIALMLSACGGAASYDQVSYSQSMPYSPHDANALKVTVSEYPDIHQAIDVIGDENYVISFEAKSVDTEIPSGITLWFYQDNHSKTS